MLNLLNENEYLAALATYDRVTGLPNRNFVEDRFAQVLASGQRYGNPFAILLVDINHFKQINDTFGHTVGDKALRAFSRELAQALRLSDTIGRYGGDEFLVIVERDVTESSIGLVCDRLVKALSFSMEEGTKELALSASVGVAFYPFDGTTTTALLIAADHAMYAAKSSPKGGYLFAKALASGPAPETQAAAESESVWVGSSREGIEGTLVFESGQPLPTAASGSPGFDSAVAQGDTSAGQDRNRRRERRSRVFKRGRLWLNDGFSTIECMVRDLSVSGARVTLDDPIALPERFSFELLDTGIVHAAIRRWQRGNSVGLELVIDKKT